MNCIKRYINSLIGFCWHPQIVLWLPVTHHGAIYKINKHKQINGNFPFSKGTLKLFAFSFFVCFEKLFHLSQFWESNTGPWKCWASPLLLCSVPSAQSVCLFVDRVSCGLGLSQTPSSPRWHWTSNPPASKSLPSAGIAGMCHPTDLPCWGLGTR